MADAEARYQTLDGQGNVAWNLVYNPSSGNWELEQQAAIEAVTGNLYLAVDGIEQQITDTLAHYFWDDFDVSGDPVYLGYQDKDGNYYIQRINIATPGVSYTKGSSAYSTAWTNRASESYADFASTF